MCWAFLVEILKSNKGFLRNSSCWSKLENRIFFIVWYVDNILQSVEIEKVIFPQALAVPPSEIPVSVLFQG